MAVIAVHLAFVNFVVAFGTERDKIGLVISATLLARHQMVVLQIEFR